MFTQQNIKETILNLEQKYPVDTWVVNNIHVWPYIRIKIYIHLLVLMNKKPIASEKNQKKIKSPNITIVFINKIVFLLKGLIGLSVFFFRLKQKQIMFFGSHIHRVIQNSEHFNRFFDSMIDYHGLQDDVYTIEYQKINEPIYNEKAVIPLNKHLDYFKFKAKIFCKLKKPKNESDLKQYNHFFEDLVGLNLKPESLNLSENSLIKWTNKIRISGRFFEKVFKCVKPKKIIFLGYYGLDDLYAALTIANKLKIKTIDFQHGPQTNIHLAFSSWNKLPKTGFNTMPVEFWNWDKASKESIDSWGKNSDVIKAKVVGQPYLAYWVQKKQKLETKRNYIFYSLQTYPFTIQDMLTPKIVSLIKALEYQWVLRLHPRNNLNLDALKSFLEENQIDEKTIVQDAFSKPLPETLLSSVIHITNYSGCLIEAYQLGIPTLLINEVGNEMFSQYIDNKLVYYLNQNKDDFESKAETLINNIKSIDFDSNYPQVFNPLLER